MVSDFNGFPKECVRFFREIKKNNTKAWFENHRSDFDQHVMEPSREFILAMGSRLRKIAPEIHADPRVNKSIFRLFRDTRFSKDKTPYKTHLGLWFWEGEGKRMECSGFYFHLDPPNLMLGVGIYMIPKHIMEECRNSVVHERYGKELSKAIAKARKVPGCEIGREHYKRVPRGFDPDHPNAEFLRYSGFYAGIETKIPNELHTPEILDFCFTQFKQFLPVHKWLVGVIDRATL